MGKNDWVIGIVVALLLYFMLASGRDKAFGSTQTDVPAPVSPGACYSQASGALSSGWGDMNQLQRAFVAVQVIGTCEGGQ